MIPCKRENYGGLRQGPVEYLVVHYTGAPGDTARNNGLYFAREQVGASAHYFVDEKEVVASVPETCTAWHCGGAHYRHPYCRNGNSIGIEICTKGAPGAYRLDPLAVERAQALIRALMAKYQITPDRVLRHYDVTGKLCPQPLVEEDAWARFKEEITMYDTLQAVPDWARPTVEKLLSCGLLQGEGESLGLSRDMVRMLTILDRAGVFEKEGRYES
ncbi:MAG: N-acetylmuramoyl-L-alanine amidase [Oscillospiraceae bacterium]|nr:N-acetylmuramoyl-L-alanine amidase [Oscillospiraceae bacterium]